MLEVRDTYLRGMLLSPFTLYAHCTYFISSYTNALITASRPSPPPAPGSRGLSTARYLSIPAEHENLFRVLLFCSGNPTPPPRVRALFTNVMVMDRGGLKKNRPNPNRWLQMSSRLVSHRPGQGRAGSKSRPALATAPPPTERDQLFPTCPLTRSPSRSRLVVGFFFFSFFPPLFLPGLNHTQTTQSTTTARPWHAP